MAEHGSLFDQALSNTPETREAQHIRGIRVSRTTSVVARIAALALVGATLGTAGLTPVAPSGASMVAAPRTTPVLKVAAHLPADTPIPPGACRSLRANEASCDAIRGRAIGPAALRALTRRQDRLRAAHSPRGLRADAPRRTRLASAVARDQGTPPTGGYGALEIEDMYGVLNAPPANATVGIVDFGQDPTIAADMATYRSKFGLPSCTVASGCFTELLQNDTVPVASKGSIGEISLDVEAVSAACPRCHITLMDSVDSSNTNVFPAIQALARSGVHYISMSFSFGEASFVSNEAHFLSQPDTIYVAASGDNGFDDGSHRCGGTPVCYPASAAGVVAAGGIRVTQDASNYYASAWKGAGSGCARFATQPVAQSAAVGALCGTTRAVADVSALADPQTGAAIYSSLDGWRVYGGTSLATPLITALFAQAGNDSDPYVLYPNSAAHPDLVLDVTTGTTTGCDGTALCAAGTGWDGPTGIGTPLSPQLFATAGSPTVTLTPLQGFTGAVALGAAPTGAPFGASGGSGRFQWTATGVPAGVSVDPTTGAWSGKPTVAGVYPVVFTATDASDSTKSGSATFTLTVSAPTFDLRTASGGDPAAVLALKGYPVAMAPATAHGATSALTWSATGLPAGLTINHHTGVVTGKPSRIGASTVDVSAEDAHGVSASVTIDFAVVTAYGCSSQLTAQVGRRVSDDCGEYWSVAPNHGGRWINLPGHLSYSARQLPAGLSLNRRTGVVTGAPRRSGQGTFVITVSIRPDGVLLTKAVHLAEKIHYNIAR